MTDAEGVHDVDEGSESSPGLRDLLRNRNFRWLWLAQIISNFGDSLTNLSLLILINRLTGSTTAIATVAILLAVPQVTLGLVAGVYVDRWDRKRIMIVSDVARGLLVLGFIAVHSANQVWLIYTITLLQATVGTFFSPARGALLANLVSEDELLAANSISQTSRVIFGLLGTASAGVLIGLLGVFWPVFLTDALTFFVSAALTLRVASVGRPKLAEQAGHIRAILGQFTDGMRLIFSSRVLSGILAAAGIAMLGLGAVNVLFVPLLINELQVSETWFGAVEGAQVGGMVIGGAAIAVIATKLKPTRIVSMAMVGLGIGVATVAAAMHIWQLLIILFAVGLVITPLNASIATLTQTLVADEMRGRLGASLNTLIGTANVASMAVAGVLSDQIGVRNVFVVAGIVAMVAGVASAWVFKGTSEEATPSVNAPA